MKVRKILITSEMNFDVIKCGAASASLKKGHYASSWCFEIFNAHQHRYPNILDLIKRGFL